MVASPIHHFTFFFYFFKMYKQLNSLWVGNKMLSVGNQKGRQLPSWPIRTQQQKLVFSSQAQSHPFRVGDSQRQRVTETKRNLSYSFTSLVGAGEHFYSKQNRVLRKQWIIAVHLLPSYFRLKCKPSSLQILSHWWPDMYTSPHPQQWCGRCEECHLLAPAWYLRHKIHQSISHSH